MARSARIPTLKPRIPTFDTRRVKPPPKRADPLYSSREWVALRDRVRQEAGGRCQVQGCNRPGHTVDHIIEVRDGGAPFDRRNTMLMCQPHHVEKTNRERAKRAGLR